jgi:uncharacterized protein
LSPKQPVSQCPICKKEGVWGDTPHRPFCSERCKLMDLGGWLDEGYRISSPLEDESDISREDEDGE